MDSDAALGRPCPPMDHREAATVPDRRDHLGLRGRPIRHRIDTSGHDGTDAVRHVVAAPHDYLGPQGADKRLVGL